MAIIKHISQTVTQPDIMERWLEKRKARIEKKFMEYKSKNLVPLKSNPTEAKRKQA